MEIGTIGAGAFAQAFAIQTVPNQRSNRTLPAWWQGSIGFQLHNGIYLNFDPKRDLATAA